MTSTEEIFLLKSPEEKNNIKHMIQEKTLEMKEFTLESFLNAISVGKILLNDTIKDTLELPKVVTKKNLYNSVIQAKNEKIDYLIDLYNSANTYNRIKFIENKIQFSKITQIHRVKLEIENFNYDIPVRYALKTYSYDGEINTYNIIPFGFNGIYGEYLELDKENSTSFNINNKTNIYFYTCHYDSKKFNIGTEIHLEYDLDYVFDENGKIIIDTNRVKHKELLLKYQPGENVFDVKIDKKLYAIEIIAFNDKLGIDKKTKKSLVIYE